MDLQSLQQNPQLLELLSKMLMPQGGATDVAPVEQMMMKQQQLMRNIPRPGNPTLTVNPAERTTDVPMNVLPRGVDPGTLPQFAGGTLPVGPGATPPQNRGWNPFAGGGAMPQQGAMPAAPAPGGSAQTPQQGFYQKLQQMFAHGGPQTNTTTVPNGVQPRPAMPSPTNTTTVPKNTTPPPAWFLQNQHDEMLRQQRAGTDRLAPTSFRQGA